MTITTWRILWIPLAGSRPRLVAMARKLGGPEQQAEEKDAREDDEEQPLQRAGR
jgi:hypothetical protein